MKNGEKIISLIRDELTVKYGDDFLALSEKEQNLLISDEIQKYFDLIKKGR